MNRLPLFVLICAIAPFSQAATYYVSTNGNDSASGSVGSPFRTVQHGINVASDGDTILVGPGFYDATSPAPAFDINVAGVTVDGQGVANASRVAMSAPRAVLRGFHCGVGDYDGSSYGAGLHFESGANNCTVDSCSFQSDNITGTGQIGVSWYNSTTNCLITNCLFRTFTSLSICVDLSGTSNTLAGCSFLDDPNVERAIDVKGYYNRIASCLFSNINNTGADYGHGSGHPDIFQSFTSPSRGTVIESNLVINCSCALGSLQAGPDGAAQNPDSGWWTLRYNVFMNVGDKLDVSMPGILVYSNTFYNSGQANTYIIGYNWSIHGQGTNGAVVGNIFALCGADPSNKGQGWYAVDEGTNNQQTIFNSLTASNNWITGASWTPKVGIRTTDFNGGDPGFVAASSIRWTNTPVANVHLQARAPATGLGGLSYDPSLAMLHTFKNWAGASNVPDCSTNGADAALFGYSTNWPTPGPTKGPYGTPAAHIGDYQYFGVTNVASLTGLSNGTVAVWAKRDTAAGTYSYILDCAFTYPATNGWTLGNDTGNPTKLYVTDSGSLRQVPLVYNDYGTLTNWHHYAFTWAGTNCIGYLDGVAFATNATPSGILTPDPANWLAIGTMQHNGTPQWGDDPYPNAAWLDGYVADARIYNTTLSSFEVQNLFYVAAPPPPPPPPPPLIGGNLPPQMLMQLTFSGWNGYTNVLDQTTNHANAIALGANGPTLVTGPFGTNAAAHFASHQWLAVTNVSLFQYLTNGCVGMWIKFDNAVGTGDFYALDGWYASPDTNCFTFGAPFGNDSTFRQVPNSGTALDSKFPDWGLKGAWHHYCISWDGTNVTSYLDGLRRATDPQTEPFLRVEQTAGWLALGVQHGSHVWSSPVFGWLNGSLADVRFYNFALRDADVQTFMQGGSVLTPGNRPPPPGGLRIIASGL